jgi:hypothetical protein
MIRPASKALVGFGRIYDLSSNADGRSDRLFEARLETNKSAAEQR